jgi:hypothetical protein
MAMYMGMFLCRLDALKKMGFHPPMASKSAAVGMPGMRQNRLAFFANRPIVGLLTIDRRHPKKLAPERSGAFCFSGAVSVLRREQTQPRKGPRRP